MSDLTLVSHSVVRGEHERSVTVVFSDGTVRTASSNQPNYQMLEELLSEPNPDAGELNELLDVANGIVRHFARLTDRVSFNGVTLTFDGDEIRGPLVDYIMRLMSETQSAKLSGDAAKVEQLEGTTEGLLRFFEDLQSNPNPESRETLHNFIERYGLTIRRDGRFVAYKGVSDKFTSIQAGEGLVNGVPCSGHLDNSPGNIVSMARSKVDSRAAVGCAVGLHAGALAYAQNWGPTVVAVAISANAVVSVPNDSEYMKLRTREYEVLFEVKPDTEDRATTSAASSNLAWTETEAEAKQHAEGVARAGRTVGSVRSKIAEAAGGGAGKLKLHAGTGHILHDFDSIEGINSWATFVYVADGVRTTEKIDRVIDVLPADAQGTPVDDSASIYDQIKQGIANGQPGILELYSGASGTKLVEFTKLLSTWNDTFNFTDKDGNRDVQRFSRVKSVTF